MRAQEFLMEEDDANTWTLRDTFKIPEHLMGEIEARIAKVNKKAAKLGASPVTLTKIGEEWEEYKQDGIKRKRLLVIVKVDGEAPKLEGWKFLGTIDYTSGTPIIREVPGEDIPVKYRSSNAFCDYCKTTRYRKETFIVQQTDGEIKQVGRNCLKDFLGGKDPRLIANAVEWMGSIAKMLSDAEDYGPTDNTPRAVSYENTEIFLAYVSASMREYGWVSRKAAWEGDGVSTADSAISSMYPGPRAKPSEITKPTEEDYVLVKKALDWCRDELANKEDISNYEHNLIALCTEEAFHPKNYGFVASLISAYQRAVEWKLKKEHKQKQQDKDREAVAGSEWQGEEKERIERDITVMRVHPWEGNFGTVGIHNMVDTDGNVYTWFASPTANWMEQGDKHTIVGTVGKHSEHNGIKQTQLKRVKIKK